MPASLTAVFSRDKRLKVDTLPTWTRPASVIAVSLSRSATTFFNNPRYCRCASVNAVPAFDKSLRGHRRPWHNGVQRHRTPRYASPPRLHWPQVCNIRKVGLRMAGTRERRLANSLADTEARRSEEGQPEQRGASGYGKFRRLFRTKTTNRTPHGGGKSGNEASTGPWKRWADGRLDTLSETFPWPYLDNAIQHTNSGRIPCSRRLS